MREKISYTEIKLREEGMRMKTAIVTGASRGIGEAIARILAADGYCVAINYCRSRNRAEQIAAELEGSFPIQADISIADDVRRMAEEVSHRFGKIDLLVNNAGIAQQKLFTDLSEEDWDRIFDTDVKGMFLTCRAFLPDMIRRKSGNIINISSIWGVTGASCEVPYSAAKAAVIGLTKSLAKEVGPSGIRVNCIAPGVIHTEMNQSLPPVVLETLREETPLYRIGTPEDVARAVLFLAGESNGFITGQVLGVNGGFVI